MTRRRIDRSVPGEEPEIKPLLAPPVSPPSVKLFLDKDGVLKARVVLSAEEAETRRLDCPDR